jgi:hypothetical protein
MTEINDRNISMEVTVHGFRGSGFKDSEAVGSPQTRLPSFGQVIGVDSRDLKEERKTIERKKDNPER